MSLHVTRVSGALGATVEGLKVDDLDSQADDLRQAWLDHQVLIFPQADLAPDEQLALARVFGEPEAHGVDGGDTRNQQYADEDKLITVINSHTAGANVWHTDATFRENPPIGAVLQLKEKPSAGGDTIWANTARAFATLAPPLQDLCRSLEARHGHPPMTDTWTHPVVRTHPITGQEVLFVNRGWTSGLRGLPTEQGTALLGLLCDHIERPEHTMRWTWQVGDIAMWDNRCTAHHAILDFAADEPRSGHRIILAAD